MAGIFPGWAQPAIEAGERERALKICIIHPPYPSAAQRPDIIPGAAHQRAERRDMLEAMSKICAFLCNAYLVRASVSMGSRSGNGGCSMLVAPDGRILFNAGQQAGAFFHDIDPQYKYTRSNGFGQPEIRNDQYIKNGRNPWACRDFHQRKSKA